MVSQMWVILDICQTPELMPSQSIQATVPQDCLSGAISYVSGAMADLLGMAVGKELPALAHLMGANMPSVVCLAHNYPFKYASMGWDTENRAWLCSLLCQAEMAGRVPPTPLRTTRVASKQKSHSLSNLMLYVA